MPDVPDVVEVVVSDPTAIAVVEVIVQGPPGPAGEQQIIAARSVLGNKTTAAAVAVPLSVAEMLELLGMPNSIIDCGNASS